MKTVYFVRHGETEGNTGKLFQGEDTPLTDKGRAQAGIVAERCARLRVETLLSSSTVRARETATIIADRIGLSFESLGVFAEARRPSELMNRSRDDIEAQQMEDAWGRACRGEGPKIGNGEDFEDLKRRAKEVFELLEKISEQKILVVTHGFFLRTLYAYMVLGPDMKGPDFTRILHSLRSDNVGITVFTNDMNSESGTVRWRMRVWNDHAHLG